MSARPNGQHEWTDAEDATLLALVAERVSPARRAEILNLPESAVRSRLTRLRSRAGGDVPGVTASPFPERDEIPVTWDPCERDEFAGTNGVACDSDAKSTRARRSPSVRRLLILGDVHSPYHDERVIALVERAAKEVFRPDDFIQVGDINDCWALSDFDKDPARALKFKDEVAITRPLVARMRSWAPNAYVTLGNHDFRFDRYIARRAPELHGLVDIVDLVGLRQDDWNVTPYKHVLQLGHLKLTHDVGFAGATAHTRSRDKIGGNTVIGHTHRMAIDYRGNMSGSRHVGAMFGWAGDLSKVDYCGVADWAEWQHGFGLGYLFPDGDIHLEPIPIVNGRCVVEGKEVSL